MTPEVEGYGCTVDELMVVAFSRAMDNDTRAFNGAVSFIPVCGYLLARRTHAPKLVWAASSIAIDANPPAIPESTLSDALWDGASMLATSPYDFWSYASGARYNTFAFRGAQMDARGNVNNTVIGPYETPKVRLPGGGGMADLGSMIPKIYLWNTTHNPRTFVEQLDFRSGIGWGDGGDHRERLGLPGGPQLALRTFASSTSTLRAAGCALPRCIRVSPLARSKSRQASRYWCPTGRFRPRKDPLKKSCGS